MLDDTDNYIKDNLQNIIDGKFDDRFSPDQLKMMLEMSFLYNHITFENDSVVFHYNRTTLEVSGLSELQFFKETIISSIKNDVVFKSALAQFLRDKKINDILR
jgi:predicted neutral ceramidase superfamily lipid hydrolase